MLQPNYSIAWVATGIFAIILLLSYIGEKLTAWAPDWCWEHRKTYREWVTLLPWPFNFYTILLAVAAILCWLFPLPKVVY